MNLAVSDSNLKDTDTKKREDFLTILKKDPVMQEKITTLVVTYNNGLADIIRSQECQTKTLR